MGDASPTSIAGQAHELPDPLRPDAEVSRDLLEGPAAAPPKMTLIVVRDSIVGLYLAVAYVTTPAPEAWLSAEGAPLHDNAGALI
jgi:hypothetical protein